MISLSSKAQRQFIGPNPLFCTRCCGFQCIDSGLIWIPYCWTYRGGRYKWKCLFKSPLGLFWSRVFGPGYWNKINVCLNLFTMLPLHFRKREINEWVYQNIWECLRFFSSQENKKGSRNVWISLSLFHARGLERVYKQ